jgi:hypothetical protein
MRFMPKTPAGTSRRESHPASFYFIYHIALPGIGYTHFVHCRFTRNSFRLIKVTINVAPISAKIAIHKVSHPGIIRRSAAILAFR